MRTDKCLAALGAADPEAVMRDIMAVKHSPLPQCYSWIEDDPNLKRWETDATCRILRIGGDPGKGKTMLMISLAQKLERMINKSPTTYFFCQSTDSRLNSATSVLQGLIWYLVTSNPELDDEFDNSFRTRGEKPFCTPNADFAELSKLLLKLLAHPKAMRINMLVDALDECDVDKQKLLDFIAEDSKRSVSKAKWLVSSRNHRNIEEALDSSDDNLTTLSLELNSAHVAQAVNMFIEIQIKELARKKAFPVEDTQKLKRELIQKADATFLWVALVFKELGNVPARKVLKCVKAFPATLTAFYGRMLEQVLRQDDEEDTALCKSVMRSMVLAQRPMSLAELGVVAGLPGQEFTRDEDISDLVRSCGSFVDIRDDTCYFVHQSAKDFFVDSEAGNGVFENSLTAEHEEIVCRSLGAMSRVFTRDDICSLMHPGNPPPDSQTIRASSLWPIRYSCSFWVFHLKRSLGDTDQSRLIVSTMVARTYDFLKDKVLRWLEALANLSQLDLALAALQDLELMCAVCDIPVLKLIRYLHRSRKQQT